MATDRYKTDEGKIPLPQKLDIIFSIVLEMDPTFSWPAGDTTKHASIRQYLTAVSE
jgi:hypothetical protein